jgi:hypothetical protein
MTFDPTMSENDTVIWVRVSSDVPSDELPEIRDQFRDLDLPHQIIITDDQLKPIGEDELIKWLETCLEEIKND